MMKLASVIGERLMSDPKVAKRISSEEVIAQIAKALHPRITGARRRS